MAPARSTRQRSGEVLNEVMDLSPRGIREHLELNRPIYARTSAYGHFGRGSRGRRRLLVGAHRSRRRAAARVQLSASAGATPPPAACPLRPPPRPQAAPRRAAAVERRCRASRFASCPGSARPGSAVRAPPGAIWLEIGFGGGEHLAAQAAAHPEVGFLGVEPFINGVAKLLRAVERSGCDNIRVLMDDARLLLWALPDASVDACSSSSRTPGPSFVTTNAGSSTPPRWPIRSRSRPRRPSCDSPPMIRTMRAGCWSPVWRSGARLDGGTGPRLARSSGRLGGDPLRGESPRRRASARLLTFRRKRSLGR